MPRTTVDTSCTLEYLSILNANGELDPDLDPGLSKDLLHKIHYAMLLSRRWDERMLRLQRQGQIGTFAPVKGQEAAQIGAASAIEWTDWIVPSYREIAAYVWRELPLEGMLLYNAGYNEGGRVPDDQHFLTVSIPVGSQMLHAAGLAYGLKRQKKEEIVLTFFGDGATSEGDFHEAMNFAGVLACPVIFLCQNNQYAISVPRAKQTSSSTLAQKAFAYDIPGLQVDGNDVLAVHQAVKEAAHRARTEHRPTLIECLTYRLSVHTTVDDPSKYRSKEEEQEWEKRDPLPRFQQYLRQKEMLTDNDLREAEKSIEQRLKGAVQAWKEQMEKLENHPGAMFDHLYAEMPEFLQKQREDFLKEWKSRSREKKHG
jgi:pyruvate dehydrogenase E1 component alpha subunit